MDKLSEMLVGTLAVVGAWLAKKLWRNIETLSDRITALEKIMLVKEDLYEIMSSNMEIMQGIVKLLTGRLRDAIN